jgi:hypothetical protein
LPSIAQRLGNVDAPDLLGSGEIGNGSRHAKHAVKPARREAHRRSGVG